MKRGHRQIPVIQNSTAQRVTLSDQTSYDASLVGVFPDRTGGAESLPPAQAAAHSDRRSAT